MPVLPSRLFGDPVRTTPAEVATGFPAAGDPVQVAGRGNLARGLVLPHRQQVTVAPISTTARGPSTEVPDGPANGIGPESVVSCGNIATIPKDAPGQRIGYLLPAQESAPTAAIRAAIGLE